MAGDGTTSVVVICGALLKKAQELLEKGIHPTVISDSFNLAANKACQVSCWACCRQRTQAMNHEETCGGRHSRAVQGYAKSTPAWHQLLLNPQDPAIWVSMLLAQLLQASRINAKPYKMACGDLQHHVAP